MSEHKIHVEFPGRIVLVGFGSIGQGVLPLLLRHTGISADRITIVTAEDKGSVEAAQYGVRFIREPLTRENYRRVLGALLGRGDLLINVSVNVSSLALIRLCWEKGAMYLDSCIEPWPGGYTDPTVPAGRRTNYALREEALALRPGNERSPTAVLTHGANPGLVSHLVKQALLNIAADTDLDVRTPASRGEWGELARQLGVRTIHVAERDTQTAREPKQPGEFVNTWSIDGFVGEGSQPSEMGWGTHERNFPRDGKRHEAGCQAAIYLMQPGAGTRVRTWTPLAGHFYGFCITHGESISIADYLTVREGSQVIYRPTVHYAYHPCDAAVMSVHEFAGRNYLQQERQRLLMEEIVSGIDELGVRTIHVAERDTQTAREPKQPGEFVNTWSIDGFVGEGSQPSEMGWGTHERNFPRDGKRHETGCQAASYLMQPGAGTRVRTWTPLAGQFYGFCITHGESISLADYLTVREGSQVVYRPTVHYAYHPCDAAVVSVHELAGRNYLQQERQRLLMDEIVSGIDELGVLLAGHKKNAYWYGSQLSIEEARRLAPWNNATSLQVTVAVLAGVVWAMENPNRGIVEPEEMDFQRSLEICRPYLGPVVGRYTDWTPLHERGRLFPEDIDATDPWQFKNVRVTW